MCNCFNFESWIKKNNFTEIKDILIKYNLNKICNLTPNSNSFALFIADTALIEKYSHLITKIVTAIQKISNTSSSCKCIVSDYDNNKEKQKLETLIDIVQKTKNELIISSKSKISQIFKIVHDRINVQLQKAHHKTIIDLENKMTNYTNSINSKIEKYLHETNDINDYNKITKQIHNNLELIMKDIKICKKDDEINKILNDIKNIDIIINMKINNDLNKVFEQRTFKMRPYCEYPNLVQIIGITPSEIILYIDIKRNYCTDSGQLMIKCMKIENDECIANEKVSCYDGWIQHIDQYIYLDKNEIGYEYKVALYDKDKAVSNIVSVYVPTWEEYNNNSNKKSIIKFDTIKYYSYDENNILMLWDYPKYSYGKRIKYKLIWHNDFDICQHLPYQISKNNFKLMNDLNIEIIVDKVINHENTINETIEVNTTDLIKGELTMVNDTKKLIYTGRMGGKYWITQFGKKRYISTLDEITRIDKNGKMIQRKKNEITQIHYQNDKPLNLKKRKLTHDNNTIKDTKRRKIDS